MMLAHFVWKSWYLQIPSGLLNSLPDTEAIEHNRMIGCMAEKTKGEQQIWIYWIMPQFQVRKFYWLLSENLSINLNTNLYFLAMSTFWLVVIMPIQAESKLSTKIFTVQWGTFLLFCEPDNILWIFRLVSSQTEERRKIFHPQADSFPPLTGHQECRRRISLMEPIHFLSSSTKRFLDLIGAAVVIIVVVVAFFTVVSTTIFPQAAKRLRLP